MKQEFKQQTEEDDGSQFRQQVFPTPAQQTEEEKVKCEHIVGLADYDYEGSSPVYENDGQNVDEEFNYCPKCGKNLFTKALSHPKGFSEEDWKNALSEGYDIAFVAPYEFKTIEERKDWENRCFADFKAKRGIK